MSLAGDQQRSGVTDPAPSSTPDPRQQHHNQPQQPWPPKGLPQEGLAGQGCGPHGDGAATTSPGTAGRALVSPREDTARWPQDSPACPRLGHSGCLWPGGDAAAPHQWHSLPPPQHPWVSVPRAHGGGDLGSLRTRPVGLCILVCTAASHRRDPGAYPSPPPAPSGPGAALGWLPPAALPSHHPLSLPATEDRSIQGRMLLPRSQGAWGTSSLTSFMLCLDTRSSPHTPPAPSTK